MANARGSGWLYVQSQPSPAGSRFVSVSVRAAGANHKCPHHWPGDRPVEGGDWGGEGRGSQTLIAKRSKLQLERQLDGAGAADLVEGVETAISAAGAQKAR
jgi:hypothetical protein